VLGAVQYESHMRIPVLGRIAVSSYFFILFQLTFAFAVLLIEPPIRLLFFIFPPLKLLADTIRRHVLSPLSNNDLSTSEIPPKFHALETTQDFVRYNGFEYESHFVQTCDNYLLNIHRIVKIDSVNHARPVVVLWHGFLMSSEVWVCNPKTLANLAFNLASKDYDVWLGNSRGNKYSSKHTTYPTTSDAFWDYSLDHLALFDLPDTIAYILAQTGKTSVTYIGFSQGTLQGFTSLSLHPKLSNSINLFVALSPVIVPHGLKNDTITALVQSSPDIIYLLFGRKSLLASTQFWQRILSPRTFATVIDVAVRLLFHWTSNHLPHKQVVYRHLYSPSSVKVAAHWFQILRHHKLQFYSDDGGKSTFPSYPTSQIKIPIALFWGGRDTLIDMDSLLLRLGCPPVFCMGVKEYEHLHFLWGENIEKIVYPHIVDLIRQHNPASSNEDIETFVSIKKSWRRLVTTGCIVREDELCWGLNDEFGPKRALLTSDVLVLEDRKPDLVARSLTRFGNVTVRDGDHVVVYDNVVSIEK